MLGSGATAAWRRGGAAAAARRLCRVGFSILFLVATDKYLEDFRSSLLQTGSKVAKHCRALPLAAGSFSVEAQRLLLITILRALVYILTWSGAVSDPT